MNDARYDALKTLLEYVRATTNLADPMLHEIDNAVKELDSYLTSFDN